MPFAVATVGPDRLGPARPMWGLEEALATVPGVFVANRYNFSVDQRITIRGFGARSAFAVRGVKILLDGIPQTLPDGQGQLTNLDLATVERIEVWSGAASVLHGNAAGGVISIWTGLTAPRAATWQAGVTAGSFDRQRHRTWTRWSARSVARLGQGSMRLTASRMVYTGERDYSAADLRAYGARASLPLSARWTLVAAADWGDQPKAQNPGALTATELGRDRDQAAPLNLARRAGKDVSQLQGGLTLRRAFAGSGELDLTLFGLSRDLVNPQTFAWIEIDRRVWGARAAFSRPLGFGVRAPHLSGGFDWQAQRDDRVNFGNTSGVRDTSRTLDQRERVRETGAFVQTTVPVSVPVTVTAGARYDRVVFRVDDRLVNATNPDDSGERPMAAVSGSLGVTWRAAARAVLYANVGTAFETPTTTELANRPTGAGGFNDSLGPQRARMLEGGVRWGGNSIRGTVAVFWADLRDALIPYEVPSAPQRRFFRNAGRATHAGIETGATVPLGSALALSASYAWSRFRYADYDLPVPGGSVSLHGRALPGVPEHRANLVAYWRRASGLWADVAVVASSGVLVNDTLDTRAGAWMRWDARAGWDGVIGAVQCRPFVAVQNLLDRHYSGSVVINAAGERYFEPAPGRNAYVGITIGGGR